MYNPYLPGEEPLSAPQKARTGGLFGGPEGPRGLGGLWDLLGKIHLDRLDSGDLLLLLVALLLWREGEEREFAIALGLDYLLELFGDDET